MGTTGYTFSQDVARRILAAVRAYERSGVSTPGNTSGKALDSPSTFWAKLTAEGTGADAGTYKWTKQKLANGEFADDTETSGAGYTASDINGTEGIDDGTYVQLWFAGYLDDGTPDYLFEIGGGDGGFWAKITASTSIGPNRWSYSWSAVRCAIGGVFQDVPGGKTSATEGAAYNTIEAFNTASGVMGNSIDTTALPPSFSILPVQGNPVVWMRKTPNCEAGSEYVFEYVNSVGGECPST